MNLLNVVNIIFICFRIPYTPYTIPKILVDLMDVLPMCQCGILCYTAPVIEKAKVLRNLRCQSIVLNHNQILHADCVFCRRKCFLSPF